MEDKAKIGNSSGGRLEDDEAGRNRDPPGLLPLPPQLPLEATAVPTAPPVCNSSTIVLEDNQVLQTAEGFGEEERSKMEGDPLPIDAKNTACSRSLVALASRKQNTLAHTEDNDVGQPSISTNSNESSSTPPPPSSLNGGNDLRLPTESAPKKTKNKTLLIGILVVLFLLVVSIVVSMLVVTRGGGTEEQVIPTNTAFDNSSETSLPEVQGNTSSGGISGDISGAVTNPSTDPLPTVPLNDFVQGSDTTSGDQFGYSVAYRSPIAVVGAPLADGGRGKVYVFIHKFLEETGEHEWVEEAVLQPPDSSTNEPLWFGVSVAISRLTIAVGAPRVDGSGIPGSVHIFQRTSMIQYCNDTDWSLQETFTSQFGGDRFGRHVALSGTILVVGAYRDNGDQGSVYVFSYTDGEGWKEESKLVADDAEMEDQFGRAVDVIDGSTNKLILVGAMRNAEGGLASGAAYIFSQGSNSSATWVQQTKLLPDDTGSGYLFGASVAIGSNMALIGAPGDSTNLPTSLGSAYIFTLDNSIWTQEQKLEAFGGSPNNVFGVSVTLAGFGHAFVGSVPNAESSNKQERGFVYSFHPQSSIQCLFEEEVVYQGDWCSGNVLDAGGQTNQFATSISASGFYLSSEEAEIWVGAPHDARFGPEDGGAAYRYQFSTSTLVVFHGSCQPVCEPEPEISFTTCRFSSDKPGLHLR